MSDDKKPSKDLYNVIINDIDTGGIVCVKGKYKSQFCRIMKKGVSKYILKLKKEHNYDRIKELELSKIPCAIQSHTTGKIYEFYAELIKTDIVLKFGDGKYFTKYYDYIVKKRNKNE